MKEEYCFLNCSRIFTFLIFPSKFIIKNHFTSCIDTIHILNLQWFYLNYLKSLITLVDLEAENGNRWYLEQFRKIINLDSQILLLIPYYKILLLLYIQIQTNFKNNNNAILNLSRNVYVEKFITAEILLSYFYVDYFSFGCLKCA